MIDLSQMIIVFSHGCCVSECATSAKGDVLASRLSALTGSDISLTGIQKLTAKTEISEATARKCIIMLLNMHV